MSPTETMRIEYDRKIPMRDGVLLSANIYRPQQEGRYPVILTRTPYLKLTDRSYETARYFVEHGYVVVLNDVRGRGDSDGVFVPYRNEGRDGYDAIEWCASQPWSSGVVGTLGGSYLGRIQWLAALEQPPSLKAMIPLVTPSDPFVESPTGAPGPMHICWAHMTSGRMMQSTAGIDWMAIYEHLPLVSMDERLGRDMPHWREECAHQRLDEWWQAICYQQSFDRIHLPVLHISGWYDDEEIGTPLNYAGMIAAHADQPEVQASQQLLMGPWGHAVNTTQRLGEVDFGPGSIIDLRDIQRRFFDRHLKGEQNGVDAEAPVRIFVMGENVWRSESQWPLADTEWTSFYLQSGGNANSRFGDGTLQLDTPTETILDSYRYDPSRPTPFITEPLSSQIGGPDDYAAVQRRDDLLVYVTEPLAEPLEVTGPIKLELFAASSARDTDFTAMLCDVHPNGFVQRICDGMVRARFRDGMDSPSLITPGEVYRYEIPMWDTSLVFRTGHRIALQVASCAFPKYDRNLNTGESLTESDRIVIAEQQILHGPTQPSRLILPIIRR